MFNFEYVFVNLISIILYNKSISPAGIYLSKFNNENTRI